MDVGAVRHRHRLATRGLVRNVDERSISVAGAAVGDLGDIGAIRLPGIDNVGALLASELVRLRPTLEMIVALLAEEAVAPVSAGEPIGIFTAVQCVGATPAVEVVPAPPAGKIVRAPVTGDHVRVAPADHLLDVESDPVAFTLLTLRSGVAQPDSHGGRGSVVSDHVVALTARDHVRAAFSRQRIARTRSDQYVGAVRLSVREPPSEPAPDVVASGPAFEPIGPRSTPDLAPVGTRSRQVVTPAGPQQSYPGPPSRMSASLLPLSESPPSWPYTVVPPKPA